MRAASMMGQSFASSSRFSLGGVVVRSLSSNTSSTSWQDTLFTEVVDKSSVLAHIPSPQKRTIFEELHWPVYQYIQRQRSQHEQRGGSWPFFLGVSAPQGCGKTTLTELLQEIFTYEGVVTASMSLDDFYLTGAEQEAVAKNSPQNSLLQYRGNAGSHDIDLMTKTFDALRRMHQSDDRPSAISSSVSSPSSALSSLEQCPGTVLIPRYDKSLREGRGDRAPVETWSPVSVPAQLVIFEGWMLGFTAFSANASPQQYESLQKIDPNLLVVNEELRKYRALHETFDSWIVLSIKSPDVVFQWRLQAEQRMRAAGKPSLTDAQVEDFVRRFMPAYEAYLPHLYSQGPQRKTPQTPVLQVEVDNQRRPVKIGERFFPSAKL